MRMPTLYQFFRHQLGQGFVAHGLSEPVTVDYVSDVLARFAHTRELYAVTDTQGRPLEYVVDLLMAAWGGDGRPTDHARRQSIRRHLGEYTLFMSGWFRDRLRARGELDYYLSQGASAYGHCADAEILPPRRALFQRLHRNFSRIADALDELRRNRLPLPAATEADSMIAALWKTSARPT